MRNSDYRSSYSLSNVNSTVAGESIIASISNSASQIVSDIYVNNAERTKSLVASQSISDSISARVAINVTRQSTSISIANQQQLQQAASPNFASHSTNQYSDSTETMRYRAAASASAQSVINANLKRVKSAFNNLNRVNRYVYSTVRKINSKTLEKIQSKSQPTSDHH